MAKYVMLQLQASGSSITQTKFREAINGCRAEQQYKYSIVFISARNCVAPFNDTYNLNTFENCVNTNLQRDGGTLEGLVAIHRSDLSQFSHDIQAEILSLVQNLEDDGNTVEGF